jgi:hypothetical protein
MHRVVTEFALPTVIYPVVHSGKMEKGIPEADSG